MKWSILILTQPSRAESLKRLMRYLEPQAKGKSDMEIVVRDYEPALLIGGNRQRMREEAAGEYSSFVDDDDLVAPDYVSRILPLLDGVDYIGWELQCFIDGHALVPTYHSLRFGGWHEDGKGYYRDLSHVNPIRRELALMMPMSGAWGEDKRWADGLREKGVVKTEHYIDAVMYYYYARATN